MTSENNISRTTRFAGVFNTDRAASTIAVIVGCGAVGRNVALQLSALGVGAVVLIDYDHVSPENIGPQAWPEHQIDKLKVEALAHACSELNGDMVVFTIPDKFSPDVVDDAIKNWVDMGLVESPEYVVFCCVDCMDTRKDVAQYVAETPQYLAMIESRMGPEQLFIQTMDPHQYDAWATTWFHSSEASPLPCTEKATTYCAAITAGFAINAWTRLLRGLPVPLVTEVNLLGQYMLTENITEKEQTTT